MRSRSSMRGVPTLLVIASMLCVSLPFTFANASEDASQAASLLSQGRSLMRKSNAEQALGLLEQALKMYTQAGDAKGAAAAHDALGDLYNRQGQYEVALQHYKGAEQGFKSSQDAYDANLMMAKVGDMQLQRGKREDARYAYSQMDARRPPDPNPLGVANKAKGLFGKMKSVATSQPSLSTGSQLSSTSTEIMGARDTYRRFIIYSVYELGIGRIDYLNNQLDDAKQHFQNALNAAGSGIPLIGGLGQTRRFRIAARTALADIALKRGNYSEAITLYKAALDGAKQDQRPDLSWPALRGIGKATMAQAAAEKDPAASAKLFDNGVASYREAIKVIESIRQGGISADDARSTFLASTKDVFDELAGALAARATQLSSSPELQGDSLRYGSDAFSVVEESRARSLLDMLAETGANITEGVPADLIEKKRKNLERQQEIAQILLGVGVGADAGTQTNEQLETELSQLQTDLDSVENQIRSASPKYAALTLPKPLTLADVQQRVLDGNTVLLEYFLGDNVSYGWAVSQKGVSLFKLPGRSTIEQAVTEFRTQMLPAKLRVPIAGLTASAPAQAQRGLGLAASGAPSEGVTAFAAASNALYKMIVEPAAATLEGKRIVVVGDGALNYVPFEALVTSPAGADYSALSYLVKTNEFAYAPSASVIGVIRDSKRRSTGKDILLVADPVFSPDDPRAQMGAMPAAPSAETRGLGLASAVADVTGDQKTSSGPAQPTLQIMRLKGTRTEADQIAQLVKSTGGSADTWLDFNASEGNVETKDLSKYRVVHFATHGLLNAEHPQFSGLILSLVGNQNQDGFLRTDEIFNMKLGSPLVMLSACETGLGKEKKGEGVIGLTRAFMYAGAPTVGVSLWSVSDRSTAELMSDFYRNMFAKADTSPAAAMRAAQQKMISDKKNSAPFYWAPFVLVGDWQ